MFATGGGMAPNPSFVQQVKEAFPEAGTNVIVVSGARVGANVCSCHHSQLPPFQLSPFAAATAASKLTCSTHTETQGCKSVRRSATADHFAEIRSQRWLQR